jgi:hypothetical protein
MKRRAYMTALVFGAVTAMAGCGSHAGYTVRKDVRSLAVPVAVNKTFYRNIEIDLTRQIVTAVEKRTPYALAASASADAVLETTIVEYRTSVLQEDANNNPTERQIIATVKFELRSGKGGRILSEGEIKEAESYAPPIGQTQAGATETLFRRTAARLIEVALEEDW